ncbi:MAG: M24 family metallopeptidase [Halothermotrichaceae bacterium]
MKKRIDKLRNLMKKEKIDGFIIESKENRYYMSGFTGTAGKILITENNSYFITDFRYIEQAEEQTDGYQIIKTKQNTAEIIAELLKKAKVKNVGFESRNINYYQYKKYKEIFETDLVAVDGILGKMRMIKDQEEIDKIKKAVEIADKAFNHICNYLEPGLTEREVSLELEYFMKKNGGERNAFDFIVASGVRSSLPHGVASDKKLGDGDFITMDFGTFYQGYCSDITRTVVLGKASSRQKEIYNIVLQAQLQVTETIKAGMSCKEADAVARDIITDAGYKENFGHGLGHGIGIEVHEGPRLSYTSDMILKENMIVTNEPGIYIPDWGGVRIEDDLLITKEGCEVLNNSSKELIEII